MRVVDNTAAASRSHHDCADTRFRFEYPQGVGIVSSSNKVLTFTTLIAATFSPILAFSGTTRW